MERETSCWREMIAAEMSKRGEDWSMVAAVSPADLDLDLQFDSGYGRREGKPFLLWTERRVYFSLDYDGSPAVASVPRAPCDEAPKLITGDGFYS